MIQGRELAEYESIVVGELEVNCYLIYSRESKKCFIVDPGDEGSKIIDEVNELALSRKELSSPMLTLIIAGGCLRLYLNLVFPSSCIKRIWISSTPVSTRRFQKHWGFIWLLNLTGFLKMVRSCCSEGLAIKIIHTPGHTPGSVCLSTGNLLFTGDTLFAGSIGRTDLPGGDFKTIQSSLDRLRSFPPETVILPGHGDSSTLKRELEFNPFL